MPDERANQRVILCGGVPASNLPFPDAAPIRLEWQVDGNVRVAIEDIHKSMWRDVPVQFQDLIDIASYVYCADQAVTRGGDGVDNMGENWRRRLFLRIPVRDPDFWSDARTQDLLVSTLSFLSEDEYLFDFTCLKERRPFQSYFPKFVEGHPIAGNIEEVVLFSGGLDSTAGAIQEAVIDKKHIVLVNHRSTDKLINRHRQVLSTLAAHAGHVPVECVMVHVNKDKGLGREYTQRSRSFLYASLGAAIAQMLGLTRIRFYENGVVSLNLPLAGQVVGARATRTTHPRVLNGFAGLFSMLSGQPFLVESPFLWKTKTEVVRLISDAGCNDIIEHTTSCTHTWERTLKHPHCGKCSQCVDRRFAVLAAGAARHDPANAYEVDLLTGARETTDKRDDLTMVAVYAETAAEIEKMNAFRFYSRYGEVSRVLRHIPGPPDATAAKMFELHQRHAKQVGKVIDDAVRRHATTIRKRTLPPTCLLSLICDTGASISTETPTVRPIDGEQPVLAQAVNYFKPKAAHWAIRYARGDEKIYDPHKGFAYLHTLMAAPGKTFSVSDLACRVARQPNMYMLGNAGQLVDDEAFQAYRVRYEELGERLAHAEGAKADAERAGTAASSEEISRIKEEMCELAQEMKRDRGLGNRMRIAASDQNRVRDRVCTAIRRALKEIGRWDGRLADHLKPPALSLGYQVVYNPPDRTEWEIGL